MSVVTLKSQVRIKDVLMDFKVTLDFFRFIVTKNCSVVFTTVLLIIAFFSV